MSRDTKLRMSIDAKIVERLDKLSEQIRKFTEHKPNKVQLCKIEFPTNDETSDYIIFDFLLDWSVARYHHKKGIFNEQDENGWKISRCDGKVLIETFGKMAVDINREVEELLDDVQVQIDLIEDPIYCPVCDHCGETGCCGFVGFLEKHVRGKTNCLHETAILDDLEEFIKYEAD